MNDMDDSFYRALADIEMVQAAYPDEIIADCAGTFPLSVKLNLTENAYIVLDFNEGYPLTSNITVRSFRSHEKARMDATVAAIKATAEECEGVESGFACVAAALDTWNSYHQENQDKCSDNNNKERPISPVERHQYVWITSPNTITDRKSVFQAHVCRIASEKDVQPALHQLLTSASKLQRATHNMYAWRVRENGILKHDNDDDGEDAAGSRLAHLLELRDEDGLLVVVSRWFGGVQLGPKRFAHISNVARELLTACHESNWKPFA